MFLIIEGQNESEHSDKFVIQPLEFKKKLLSKQNEVNGWSFKKQAPVSIPILN